jgi:hypothetical protein
MAFDTGHFPVNGGSYPPFGQITDTNHGSYIIIATWIFASISVLFVVVRLALRARQSHRFGPDNAFVVGALVRRNHKYPTYQAKAHSCTQVFAIGQSISASESVQYGLGRHLNALGEDDLRSYYRV